MTEENRIREEIFGRYKSRVCENNSSFTYLLIGSTLASAIFEVWGGHKLAETNNPIYRDAMYVAAYTVLVLWDYGLQEVLLDLLVI